MSSGNARATQQFTKRKKKNWMRITMNAIIGAVAADIYNAWCAFSMSSESERAQIRAQKKKRRERERKRRNIITCFTVSWITKWHLKESKIYDRHFQISRLSETASSSLSVWFFSNDPISFVAVPNLLYLYRYGISVWKSNSWR